MYQVRVGVPHSSPPPQARVVPTISAAAVNPPIARPRELVTSVTPPPFDPTVTPRRSFGNRLLKTRRVLDRPRAVSQLLCTGPPGRTADQPGAVPVDVVSGGRCGAPARPTLSAARAGPTSSSSAGSATTWRSIVAPVSPSPSTLSWS